MQTMSSSRKTKIETATVTKGQARKIGELLAVQLLQSGIPQEPCQNIIRRPNKPLFKELVGVIQRFVEATKQLIFRTVTVDRTRSPEAAIAATGRKEYVDKEVVGSMPKGKGKKVEVCFFKLDMSTRGGQISDDDLEEEYTLRGLIPCDPYSLAKVNEDDPAFADEWPNATHWKENGRWCYATFCRWHVDERSVIVHRYGFDWRDYWWFAGLRK